MCEIMEQSNLRAKKDLLYDMVAEGTIHPEIAAEKLGMSIHEILDEMQEVGYSTSEASIPAR